MFRFCEVGHPIVNSCTRGLPKRVVNIPLSSLFYIKGLGSHVHVCPRPCSSTRRWAGVQPTDTTGPRSACIPCSHAHLGRAPTACVSSPRDWAVSIGSHMQQDTDMSEAPPRTVSFALDGSRQKPQQKNGHNVLPQMTDLGACFIACLTPRRAQDDLLNDTEVVVWCDLQTNSKKEMVWCGLPSRCNDVRCVASELRSSGPPGSISEHKMSSLQLWHPLPPNRSILNSFPVRTT